MAAHGYTAPIQALQSGVGERIIAELEDTAEPVQVIDTETVEQIEGE
jgi:hypothetical protein